MVTMTDAKGDFLSYIVSLTSLQLQTAGGATVETILAATKVDFTKLVDLSEVLSAGQIPPADYVSAKLTIDYTNAQLSADDGTGNPVALAPVDSAGNAITGALTVTVLLDPAHQLRVTAGALARLALDFNLAVSNAVDLTAGTVTVTPTLVASLVPSDTQPIRVRGSLVSTTAAQDQFVLAVQPFHDESAPVGQVTVQVGAATTYQVNGTSYLGDAGLTALAALAANTKVAAFGTEQTGQSGAQPVVTATNVLAGSSLENPGQDQLSGTVIARDQTTLTVRAATWSDGHGDFDFEQHDAKVKVGTGTVVVEEGRTGVFTVTDISVGQHIDVTGVATRGSDHALSVDATSGAASLKVTALWGTVTGRQSGSLSVTLQSLDGLPASVFNFSGTGIAAASDALPNAYVVATGSLDQSAVTVSSVTGARGFVTPFGTAPPDFTAQTLIALPAIQAELNVHFDHGGSPTAFLQLTSTSTSLLLQLPNQNQNQNQNDGNDGNGNSDNSGPGNSGGNGNDGNGNSGGNGDGDGNGNSNGNGNSGNSGPGDSGGADNNFLQIGPRTINLTNTASPLAIVPNPSANTDVFTIDHQGPMRSETFYDFASFVAALAGELGNSVIVHAVSATGQYDSSSNTLTATRIAVVLTN